MRDRKITRTTKELEDLLMVNEKKQRSSMEELLAEMESAVARVEKREREPEGKMRPTKSGNQRENAMLPGRQKLLEIRI